MRPKPRYKFTAAFCWLYPLAIALLWLLICLGGDRWWPATLLLFGPRWLGLLPLLLLTPLALWRQRRLLWPLAVGLLLQLFPVMGLRIPFHRLIPRASNARSIRVLTFNAHEGRTNRQALESIITDTRPDVVLIQDWSKRIGLTFYNDPAWHVHWSADRALFLASKFPILSAADLPFANLPANGLSQLGHEEPGEALRYTLQTPLGTINVWNIHLTSPHRAFDAYFASDPLGIARIDGNSRWRLQESQAIAAQLRTLNGPILLAGDFNTPMDSAVYRAVWSNFLNAFSQSGFGFGYTYYTHHNPVRIDQILAAPGWRCLRCWVAPDVGSPHRPLIADMQWTADTQP